MEKVKEALWKDYEIAKSKLEELTTDSDEYKVVSAEVDSIRKELINVGQIEIDKEIKENQIQNDNKRESTKNRIAIGTFVVSTGISLYALSQTFKFDEFKTVTSTLGRNILNSFLPKRK